MMTEKAVAEMRRALDAANRASVTLRHITSEWRRLGIRDRAVMNAIDETTSALTNALSYSSIETVVNRS